MKWGWLLVAVWLPGSLLAQDAADRALADSEALMQEAARSQQRIEQLDDATREALRRYREALQEREQLAAYNARLRDMVAAQRSELGSLQEQLASIEETQQAVLPMLQSMVNSLERFVELDLPFLPEERAERLTQLRDLVARADVSLAEKYRRVLEAYQIESEYGRSLEAWRGTLVDGERSRVVDFLRLGRMMLFYQTLDGREQGRWDVEQGTWVSLTDRYQRSLEQGLRIARQQQTPVMLRLPLPPVEDVEVRP